MFSRGAPVRISTIVPVQWTGVIARTWAIPARKEILMANTNDLGLIRIREGKGIPCLPGVGPWVASGRRGRATVAGGVINGRIIGQGLPRHEGLVQWLGPVGSPPSTLRLTREWNNMVNVALGFHGPWSDECDGKLRRRWPGSYWSSGGSPQGSEDSEEVRPTPEGGAMERC